MSDLYLREETDENGTPRSVFKCFCCGEEFSITPAVSKEIRPGLEAMGCGDGACDSYNPRADLSASLGDYQMFNEYCERNGIPPEKLAGQLPKGDLIREDIEDE